VPELGVFVVEVAHPNLVVLGIHHILAVFIGLLQLHKSHVRLPPPEGQILSTTPHAGEPFGLCALARCTASIPVALEAFCAHAPRPTLSRALKTTIPFKFTIVRSVAGAIWTPETPGSQLLHEEEVLPLLV